MDTFNIILKLYVSVSAEVFSYFVYLEDYLQHNYKGQQYSKPRSKTNISPKHICEYS